MGFDGTLKFDTSLDASGVQKGANQLKDIVSGLGIFEILKQGVQLVTDSVQQAMHRIDTMDQFSRVMTTMTGSTETANAALKQTTEIVTGTAYGLDYAAQAVQNFVSRGMDVDGATESVAAWGDAVAFYGDGSNEQFGRVTDALSKMYTKGNVTMEHMNMLLDAGIPAIEIYADAMGMSTEEVTKSMSKGQLSAKQFVTVMNSALANGTSKFPAIAGAAKEAGASWAGTFDNMHAAVARGTSSIIQSFDEMFNVKEGIAAFGKAVETALKFVAENLTFLVPTILAATAAFTTWKIVNAVSSMLKKSAEAISIAQKAVQLYTLGVNAQTAAEIQGTAASKGLAVAIAAGNVIKTAAATIVNTLAGSEIFATAATGGLAGAIKALGIAIHAALGVFGLILLVIVAVVAAIAAIVNVVQQANKEYYAEKDALKELKEEHEGYADALLKSKDAAREEGQEKVAQAQANRALLGSIAELVDANGNVVGSVDEVQSKISEANSSIEGLGLAFDETTGQLNMNRSELEEYGAALEAVATHEAAQSEYNNILKEKTSLQAKINALEAKKEIYNRMVEEGTLSQYQANNLIKDADDLLKDYGESYGDLEIDVQAYAMAANNSFNSEAEIAVKRQEIANNQMDQVKQLAQQYGITADAILDAASKMAGGLDEWAEKQAALFTKSGMDIGMVAEKWGLTTDQVQAYMDEWGMSLDEFNEHMKSTHTESGASLDDLAAKYGTTREAIEREMKMSEISLDQWEKAQKDKLTKAGENIHQVAAKWGVSVLAIQAAMDAQGLSLDEWSNNQQKAFEDWQKTVETHKDAVVNSFKEIPTEFEMSANEMIEVLRTNRERYAEWQANMRLVSSLVSSETVAELQKLGPGANSAIKEMLENGGKGLREFDAEVRGSISDSVAYANSTLNDPAFTASGKNMMGLYSGGVSAGAPQVNTAVNDVVNGAVTAADASANTGMATSGAQAAQGFVSSFQSVDMSGITSGIAKAISTGSYAVNAAAKSMAAGVISDFNGMSSGVASNVRNMMTNIAASIRNGSSQVQSAVKAMTGAVQSGISEMATGMNAKITAAASSMRSAFVSLSSTINSTIRSMASTAQSTVSAMMIGITGKITTGSKTVTAAFTGISTSVAKVLTTLKTNAANIATQTITAIANAFKKNSGIVTSANAIVSSTAAALRPLVEQASSIGIQAINGMLNAMNANASRLYAKAAEIANNVANTMRRALDIHSPSHVTYQIFEMVAQGAVNALADNVPIVEKTATEFAGGTLVGINEGVSSATVNDMFSTVMQGGINALIDSTPALKQAAESAAATATAATEKEMTELEKAMKSLADQIKSEADTIINNFKAIPDAFEMSLSEMTKVIRSNTAIYAEWRNNLRYLSAYMTKESLEELEKLGPGANSILRELIAGGKVKIEEFDRLLVNGMTTAADGVVDALSGLMDISGIVETAIDSVATKTAKTIAEAAKTIAAENKKIADDNKKLADDSKRIAEEAAMTTQQLLKKRNAELDKAISAQQKASDKLVAAQKAEQDALKAAQKAQEEYTKNATAENKKRLDDTLKTLDKATQARQKAADAAVTAQEKVKSAEEAAKKAAEEAAKEAEAAIAAFKKSVETHTNAIINNFKAIPDAFEMSLDDMIKTLTDNAAKYEQWQQNLALLSGKLSKEALAELQKLGPGANSVLEELIAGGDTKITEFNNAITAGIKAATGAAKNELEGFPEAFENSAELADTGEQIATGVVQGFKNGKLAEMVTTVVQTITNGTPQIVATVKTLGTEMLKASVALVNNNINAWKRMITRGREIARDVILGMVSAVNEYAGQLYAAAQAVASTVISTLRSAFDIHSPSGETYDVFTMVMLGGINAIKDGSKKLFKEVDRIPAGIMDRLEKIPPIKLDMLDAAFARGSIVQSASIGVPRAGGGNSTVSNNTTTNAPVIHIHGDINSPDAIARKVGQTMRYGLAGGKA